MSKHSDDYKKLMRLIHDDGYILQETSFKLERIEKSKEEFIENTKFVLKKGEDRVVLESVEGDLGMLVWHLKQFPDLNNNNEFRKVKNLEKYYNDIKFLIDEKGSKLKNVASTLKKEGFHFTYDPDALLDVFLNEKSNKNRASKKYVKLREDYYQILLFQLQNLKSVYNVLEKYKKEDTLFEEYNDFLFKRIMEFVKADKPIDMYKKIVKVLRFNPLDKLNIHLDIINDRNVVLDMIKSHFGEHTHVSNVLPRLLDMYRKDAEFSSDYIEFFSIIEHSMKGEDYDENCGFSGNYEYLMSSGYSGILKNLNPQVRNSESHLNTKIDKKKEKILITEQKLRERKILQEYSYKDFTTMLQDLERALSVALMMSVTSAYLIILHMVLMSFEYKILLLGIDNRE